MQKQNKNKTVAPVAKTEANHIEETNSTKPARGRKAGVGNFVNINITKLTSLVGNGNVQVRRGWLEEILERQTKAEIAEKISALSEPETKGGSIEMNIEE